MSAVGTSSPRSPTERRETTRRPVRAIADHLQADVVSRIHRRAFGVIPEAGGCHRLARLIGLARAKELGGEQGIRFLITAEVAADVVTESLGIMADEHQAVVEGDGFGSKAHVPAPERHRVVGHLDHRFEHVEIEFLWHYAQQLLGTREILVRIDAKYTYLATRLAYQRADHADRSGLTRAVGAEQADDLSALHA